MAFFFGRLDSHILRVRRSLLGPLYLYVALQMSWVLFWKAPADSITWLHFSTVLVLKIYMYVAITHWIVTGDLRVYIGDLLNWQSRMSDSAYSPRVR